MPRFLDTRGRTKIAIAVCGRCGIKMSYDELRPDPNYPGVFVCNDDYDDLDPYRLPARITEDISLEHPRPDFPISDPSPVALYGNQQMALLLEGTPTQPLQAASGTALAIAEPVTQLNPSNAWAPNTQYNVGDQVTARYPYATSTGNGPIFANVPSQPFWQFTCIVPGISGATAPVWPPQPGVGITDLEVIWINTGIFLP